MHTYRTPTIYSAHDTLAIGFFKYMLEANSDETRSLATIVRTNPTAISIFRSLYNIDPIDVLEDFLTRKRVQSIDVAGCLAALEDTGYNLASHLSVITEVTGHTRLRYAITFSPDNVVSLLADREDAAEETTLVYAIYLGRNYLIKPLLDAGADVNMRDWRGYTTLHEACSCCLSDGFFELLRWAENAIDWGACTPQGWNALELFDLGVLSGWATHRSQTDIDEFRAALMSHMKLSEKEVDGRINMPGAFPDAS